MEGFRAAIRLLPGQLRSAAAALPEEEKKLCEEFRLRRGQRASVLLGGGERALSDTSVTEDDILAVTEAATGSSLHAAAAELSRGYIQAGGGVRVGVCGTAAGAGCLHAFSSVSIRVPRAVSGCADTIWSRLTEGGFSSTLIVSPPGGGKTTLLREISRRLSCEGMRVCIADERGEIAAAAFGMPGFDLGPCADVMTGVSRERAVMMLLRAMNPQVMVMDEITEEEDADSLLSAVGCGVRLLASAHGGSADELYRRPAVKRLMDHRAFSRLITVFNHGGRRSYRVEEIP